MPHTNDAHFAITVFIALLLIASGVAMATKWIRVPYTLALVVVGLVISPMHFLPPVHVSPELILLIFLPALLFEAAWNLKLDHLRENLWPILTLAVPGVCLSVSIARTIVHFGIGWPWITSLLFGAMICATDPVSVLALFRKLGLSQRLTTIVEGESLFNDGTAVVVFKIIVAIAIGAGAEHSFGGLALDSVREFLKVVLGGLALGGAIGLIASAVTARFDDHLLEITLTTLTAYGSFLGAETLHLSPVIAVLTAGLILGNYGRQTGMSPTTQVAVNSFWEYAAFVVNSLVFLLIGLETQLPVMFANIRAIAWGVAAMLVARLIAVYGLMPLVNRMTHPVPFRWQHVLVWGGLRGSLSIALALSLPRALPYRAELIMLIFGSVIFSLLAQGLTIPRLLQWLGLSAGSQQASEYDLVYGQLLTETAAAAELEDMHNKGLVTKHRYAALAPTLQQQYTRLSEQLTQLDAANGTLEKQQQRRLQEHLVNVKKARLKVLLHDGLLGDEAHRVLSERLDEELATLQEAQAE